MGSEWGVGVNLDEKLVKEYLGQLGYKSIIHEPDGNVPPDFLLDSEIAVEVRRLNQNYTFHSGGTKGLEEQSIPLRQKLDSLLNSFGLPINNRSWLIGIRFKRPIEPWNKLKPKIQKLLDDIKNQGLDKLETYEISENFTIKINPASAPLKSMFLMATSVDGDSGGWVLNEMETNLRLVIIEKSKKIEKFKLKYKEWWLVLPNHIGYSLKDFEEKQFKEMFLMNHDWDKIILINPLNPSNAFEL